MKTLQVDFPASLRQPPITLEYAAGVPDADARWLADHLRQSSAAGRAFERGEVVPVGGMVTRLLDAGDRGLVLSEPDMRSMPIHFEPGVSRTLTILRLQKDVADSVGLVDRLDFAPITSGALVCTQLAERDFAIMDRAGTGARDSGWFLGCSDASHDHDAGDNLRRISIYELMVRVPAATPFLALPVSSAVLFDGGWPTMLWCDGQAITARPGSLLERLIRRDGG